MANTNTILVAPPTNPGPKGKKIKKDEKEKMIKKDSIETK
jgi:hypothetical protein